jgi:proteasome lid subunit RPN8/RPN11
MKSKDTPSGGRTDSDGKSGDDVSVGGQWTERKSLRWLDFPIREEIDEPIRVTFSPKAYAEVVSQTKTNLDTEICGVLAGQFCEDDYGMYVFVRAVIEGSAAEKGVAHVTYTQETWTEIHERMEKDYPHYDIVGWYHSHPGFGVAFSDMDLFIQENFFAGRGQIAYVSDPLGGEEAICVNTPSGIEHASRFWVDDRQRKCSAKTTASSPGGQIEGASVVEALESVEQRLRQTLQSVDALRTSYHRFLGMVGMMIAVGILFGIGYVIFEKWNADTTPPRIQTFAQGPVKVGGKWRWISSTVVTRDVPPQVASALRERERQEFIAAELKRQGKSGSPAASQPGAGAKSTGKPPADQKTKTTPPVESDKAKTPKDSTP